MEQIYLLIIGILILALGIPIGKLLAYSTKEELRSGKKWFKLLVIISSVGAIIFLILGNDTLLFGLLLIAIVTSQSLKR